MHFGSIFFHYTNKSTTSPTYLQLVLTLGTHYFMTISVWLICMCLMWCTVCITKEYYARSSYNTCTECVSRFTRVQRVWTTSLTKIKLTNPAKILSPNTQYHYCEAWELIWRRISFEKNRLTPLRTPLNNRSSSRTHVLMSLRLRISYPTKHTY
jgi:hypothetical protein